MRDSWIDKDELNKLVESFSPEKRRRRPFRVQKHERETEKTPEPRKTEVDIPQQLPVETDDSVAISSIDLIDDYAAHSENKDEELPSEENELVEWNVEEVEIIEEVAIVKEVEIVEEVAAVKEDFVIAGITVDNDIHNRGSHFFSCDDVDDEVNAELDASSKSYGGHEPDAARAVKSLAEARNRAYQVGLIREKTEISPTVPEDDFQEKEEEEEQSFVDEILNDELFTNIPVPTGGDDSGFTREETTRRRIQKFASLLHEKLDASSVLVMDGEGFPLYEESNGSSSIPIEKSGGPLRLVYEMQRVASSIGLEDRVSSQVSIGNGKWLCLLYSAETEDDGPMVRAVVSKPLGGDQLLKWSNLLGSALLFDGPEDA